MAIACNAGGPAVSAVGFLYASVSFEFVRSRYATLDQPDLDGLNAFFDEMITEALAVVRAGAPEAELLIRKQAFMRYHGQGHEIEIALPDRAFGPADIKTLRRDFDTENRSLFRRAIPGMSIEILNWPVEVSSPPCPQPGS